MVSNYTLNQLNVKILNKINWLIPKIPNKLYNNVYTQIHRKINTSINNNHYMYKKNIKNRTTTTT